MSTLGEFFNMGGYALYVWGSYALAFIMLAANIVIPILRERRLRRALTRGARQARRPA